MKRLLPLFAASFILASCENPLNTMKEMRDTTKEMNEKMNETNKNTSNLGAASRHGFTEDKRDKKVDELIEEGEMGEALTHSKVLVLAYEFQSWDGIANHEGLEEREELIGDALDELYRTYIGTHGKLTEKRKVLGVFSRKTRMEKMSPLDLDGENKKAERAFYAISTVLHYTDLLQRRTIKQNEDAGRHMEEISLYDVIKSALLKESRGEAVNENEAKVLVRSYKDMAIDMLQARMSFMTALALKELVTKEEMSFKDKLSGLLFKASGGKYGALKVDSLFAESNDPTREQVMEYLDGALKTKAVLEEIGVEPRLQKEVKSIMENLELALEDDNIGNSYGQGGNDLQKDTNKLMDMRGELLRQNI